MMGLLGHESTVNPCTSAQCVGKRMFKIFVSHLSIRILFLWVIYGRCTWFSSVVIAFPVPGTGFLPEQWKMQNDGVCPCPWDVHSSVLPEGACCWCWGQHWSGNLWSEVGATHETPSNWLQVLHQALPLHWITPMLLCVCGPPGPFRLQNASLPCSLYFKCPSPGERPAVMEVFLLVYLKIIPWFL